VKRLLDNFQLMFEALTELGPEFERSLTRPLPVAPSLESTLSEIGPQPKEALLLGLAPDGLPVLLNLEDPRPGPLLIAADPGAGKTAILQLITQAARLMHLEKELAFGVITNYPDEWEQFAHLPHTIGIYPAFHNSASDFLRSLSGWAHANRQNGKSVLLLIDDLENMGGLDFEIRQVFRWLLFRGPSRGVWPIVTMDANRMTQVQEWLESFATIIYGHIKDDLLTAALTNSRASTFSNLHAGLQFAVQENEQWLHFWLPEI
jgi:hypothetical protein